MRDAFAAGRSDIQPGGEASALTIGGSPLFAGLGSEQVAALDSASSVVWVGRNRHLYRADEPLSHLYVVGSGSFKLVRHSEEGREFIVGLVGRGEAFGAMVEAFRSTAEARGLEESITLAVPLASVRRVLEENPVVGLRLVKQAEEKLRATEIRAASIAFESVPRRLASFLLETADPETGRLRFPLNQSEMAQIIGSSRETVCSFLNQLRREGVVENVSGRVQVTDRRVLETVR